LWSVASVKEQAVEAHGQVLYGHEDEVATLAFTADGQTLISGSMDYTIRLWAVTSGQALGVLRGHSAGVTRVVVGSPPGADGQQIASNSFDFTLRLWDVRSGQSLHVRSGNGIGNRTVAFSPDGVLLAYVVEAVVVEIWNNRQQQVLHRLRGHTSSIKTLAFSPVAPLLASSGWDGLICLWDLATGDCLHTLHPEGPYAGMKIRGVTGISEAQKAALQALGAVEE
jgi:WD40 repeat protein